MRIVRSLLLLLALGSPALAHDGPRHAAAARDAAQAFQRYIEDIAKTGGRPDLTRPDVAKLLGQMLNLDALMALPAPQASDIPWTSEWIEASNVISSTILTYGAGPRSKLDAAAVQRNLTEYEDQYAAAMNFEIRLYAHQLAAFNLALARLSPAQRTPAQQEAVKQMRIGAAEMIVGAIQSMVLGGTPANSRLVAAAIRDTRDVWAAFFLPEGRADAMNLVARSPATVKDDEARRHLAAFAAALQAVN